MSGLAIVRVAAIWIGLVWKGYHLARRPGDPALRAVVACIGAFALSTPIRMMSADSGPLGLKPTVIAALEYSLIAIAVYCLVAFFAARQQSAHLRSSLVAHGVVLTIAVALTITFGALAPATVEMRSYTNPYAIGLYLVSELYIAAALAITTRGAWSLARSRETGATQALGMGITAAGMAVLSVATALLCVVHFSTLSGLGYQSALGRIGGYGLLVGGPIFILGVVYPGAVMRVRAVHLWLRRLSQARQLHSLWHLINRAFSQHASGGWDRVVLHGRHRQWQRRKIESRDGLVRLSSHLPDELLPEITLPIQRQVLRQDLAPLARWLVANASDVARDGTETGVAKPILVPPTNDTEADAEVLMALSAAISDVEKEYSWTSSSSVPASPG